ncbi:hypothetical protein AYO20_11146 [Fonsecaea nubica]|uniref:Ketoreductase (KR) domain-containing protein n=1 Tax=Fonsecaea nubica TaxID=856822 RepID=A0A178BZR6_9EURO|nr:hypothetical protein AYO20_11146 [Fonsecaea nubica]OAL22694.1 hypothetical protein AYO20_11146 [Fonsecaea nubica]
MVKLDTARALGKALVQSQPLVAVFFGGTGGIGQVTLRALATAEAQGGKGLRAYVVGRNAQAAEDMLAECRGICPQGRFKFIQAQDLSLLGDVDRVCAEIIRLEKDEGQEDSRVDYLMVSQGGMPFLPRKDTKEGIDVTMSLMYYSRMRIITKLLPLLLNSRLPAATVVSVYAAGTEGDLDLDDLSLRDTTRYKYTRARSHMCYMHTLFMEELAQCHPGKLSLVHIFPGIVVGPGFHSTELPMWFRILFHWVVLPLFGRLLTVPPAECGERMLSLGSDLYPAHPPQASPTAADAADGGSSQTTTTTEGVITGTSGTPGSGVYSLTWNGESNFNVKAYQKINREDARLKVWEHTVKCFEVVEAGKVFKE